MLAGLAGATAAYALYGLAPSGGWFLAAIPLGSLAGLYSAGVQALMTQRVGPGEQGQLQGVNSSVLGLVGLIGPGLFSLTFASAISAARAWRLPGAPFLLAALLTAAALLLAIRVARPAAVARD